MMVLATKCTAGFSSSSIQLPQRYVDYRNSVAAAISSQGLSGVLLELAVRVSDLGGIRPVAT